VGAASGREVMPDQEIPVAMQEVNCSSRLGQRSKCSRNLRIERVGGVVVADPVLEQVTQDIKRRCRRRSALQEIKELLVGLRPLGRQMQIRDKEGVGHFG